MANFVSVNKKNMEEVFDGHTYTNRNDAQNGQNSIDRGRILDQWWGDDNRDILIDLDSGLLVEAQESGEYVPMSWTDDVGIKALTKKSPTKPTTSSRGTAYEPPYVTEKRGNEGTSYSPNRNTDDVEKYMQQKISELASLDAELYNNRFKSWGWEEDFASRDYQDTRREVADTIDKIKGLDPKKTSISEINSMISFNDSEQNIIDIVKKHSTHNNNNNGSGVV